MNPRVLKGALRGLALALSLSLVVVVWKLWTLRSETAVLEDRLLDARQIAAEPCLRLGGQIHEAIELVSSSSPPPREGTWNKYYAGALIGAIPWIDHCAGESEQVTRARAIQSQLMFLDEATDKDRFLVGLRELQAIIPYAPRTP